jgi:hypothetical protein
VARIFEKDAVNVSEFVGAFLSMYLKLLSEETTYFNQQFPDEEVF